MAPSHCFLGGLVEKNANTSDTRSPTPPPSAWASYTDHSVRLSQEKWWVLWRILGQIKGWVFVTLHLRERAPLWPFWLSGKEKGGGLDIAARVVTVAKWVGPLRAGRGRASKTRPHKRTKRLPCCCLSATVMAVCSTIDTIPYGTGLEAQRN